MRETEINRLVLKLLKAWGFALFAKKAKILLQDEIPEFSRDIFLSNDQEIFSWNLLKPDEKQTLVFHIDLIQKPGKSYFRLVSKNQEVFYTKKPSIDNLQEKIVELLELN